MFIPEDGTYAYVYQPYVFLQFGDNVSPGLGVDMTVTTKLMVDTTVLVSQTVTSTSALALYAGSGGYNFWRLNFPPMSGQSALTRGQHVQIHGEFVCSWPNSWMVYIGGDAGSGLYNGLFFQGI
jgi:hypothetical protein